ncbi:hypothetical protein [Streptomyces sp. NEAU-NA10]|uniref:hypothetical protein n=1 Tax=Streptomyces sp. NEAU-NA10 TaxID=3416050 RepID=UPI003CC640EA
MSRRPRSPRTAVSAVLIALACLLLPFGTLAAWAAYGLTDTGRYVTTMAPLASDPAVRDAVADTVGEGILREAARDGLQPPAEVAPFVHDAVLSFTRTPAFHAGWDAANEATHQSVMAALRDDRADDVTVDLTPVAARVQHRLAADRLPFAEHVPATHARVTVLPARDLAALRKGYRVLDVAGFWLPLTAVALAVTGIAVAACRRRALTATALGTALGGAFLGLAVAVGRRLTLADLPDRRYRPAAAAVYDALTATLRTASWLLLVLGLAVAGGVWGIRYVHVRRAPPAELRRCRRPLPTHPPDSVGRRGPPPPGAPPRPPRHSPTHPPDSVGHK